MERSDDQFVHGIYMPDITPLEKSLASDFNLDTKVQDIWISDTLAVGAHSMTLNETDYATCTTISELPECKIDITNSNTLAAFAKLLPNCKYFAEITICDLIAQMELCGYKKVFKTLLFAGLTDYYTFVYEDECTQHLCHFANHRINVETERKSMHEKGQSTSQIGSNLTVTAIPETCNFDDFIENHEQITTAIDVAVTSTISN